MYNPLGCSNISGPRLYTEHYTTHDGNLRRAVLAGGQSQPQYEMFTYTYKLRQRKSTERGKRKCTDRGKARNVTVFQEMTDSAFFQLSLTLSDGRPSGRVV